MRRGLAVRLRLQEDPAGVTARPDAADRDESVATIRGRLLTDCPGLIDAARTDPAERERLAGVIDRLIVDQNIIAGDLTREGLIQLSLSEIVGFGPPNVVSPPQKA